jgi:peptidylprolyl isomerase
MKSMLHIFAAAVVSAAALTACGGGSDKTPTTAPIPAQPDYKLTETKVGTTGDAAAAGDTAVFNYTGYLYDATKDGGKGVKVESTVDAGSPRSGTVGVGVLPAGWDMALVGMKAGGTRSAILPANLTPYLAAGRIAVTVNGVAYPAIPASSPLVYDFEMVSVTKAVVIPSVPPPTVLTISEVLPGIGAPITSGQQVRVRYTGWFYDGTRDNRKGVQFDSNLTGDLLIVDVGATTGTHVVIPGFSTTLVGMQLGSKRTVIIPPALGYGVTTASPDGRIPANSTLVFDIQVIAIP